MIDTGDKTRIDDTCATESFRMKVTRDVSNDDATGDAELWGLEIRET